MSEKHILFVDDSSSIRNITGSVLVQAGYQVTLAEDGEDALTKFGGPKIHLVITDVHMPKMDGFELIENIRKMPEYARVPILALVQFNA